MLQYTPYNLDIYYYLFRFSPVAIYGVYALLTLFHAEGSGEKILSQELLKARYEGGIDPSSARPRRPR